MGIILYLIIVTLLLIINKYINRLDTMKQATIFIYSMLLTFALHAQSKPATETEPTKQQALDYLKNIIAGEVKYYISGGPLTDTDYSGSTAILQENIEIISVSLIYDVLEIKAKNVKDKEMFITYKTSLKNEFEVYNHCICQIKDKTSPVPPENGSYGEIREPERKRYEGAFVCFGEQSSIMVKALNAMEYLRKFIKKDPFER